MRKPVTITLTIAAFVGATLAANLAFSQSPKPADTGTQTSPASATTAMANQASAATAPSEIDRGRYLVKLGDCVACHTQKGGAEFAGGRPLETPFGTVLSANLTPDEATGIGRYTTDTFYRAMTEGVDKDGHHLYPAFPYNYYTRVTRQDSDAMFAYFHSLAPVSHPLDRNQMPFPFNIRGLMVVWNWMFLDKGTYQNDPAQSAEWNRGAYLVEGLGHCQACHTPKNLLGGNKSGEAFYGGTFGDWFAPDITQNTRVGIGSWKPDALREYLHAGRNAHSAASGEMGEVVAYSTSQMTDADLQSVVTYMTGVQASPVRKVTAADQVVMRQGEAIWRDQCAACHRTDATGIPRYFPPMQANANLQQTDPATIIHYILVGANKVATDTAPTPMAMPAFDWKLDDQQVAAVATYARNSWGNAASPVEVSQVALLRKKLVTSPTGSINPTPGSMVKPGPGTLAPANTDSRDNGSAQAGRKVAG